MAQRSNSAFISYRREVGGVWALAVYQRLQSQGIDVFYDIESIRGPGQLDSKILTQIGARPYFLLVLTPGTLERCHEPGDWLRLEIEHAVSTGRTIVPLHTPSFDFADCDAYLPPGPAARIRASSGLELSQTWFKEALQRLEQEFLLPVDVDAGQPSAEAEAHVLVAAAAAALAPEVTTARLQAQELFEHAYARGAEDLAGRIADLDEAIRLDPGRSRLYFERGRARKAHGDDGGARADFRQAASLDPYDPDPRRALDELVSPAWTAPYPAPLPPPLPTPTAPEEAGQEAAEREAAWLERRPGRRRLLIGLGLAALVLVGVLVSIAFVRDGGDEAGPATSPATNPSASTTSTSTTSTSTTSTTTTAPQRRDTLVAPGRLGPGDRLESQTGGHSLEMTGGGILVARTGTRTWWEQPVAGPPGSVAIMQDDGNFVVYRDASLTQPVWSTQTERHPGARLALEDVGGRGVLSVYDGDGSTVLWRVVEASPVPSVVGLTEQDAVSLLGRAGFLVEVERAPTDGETGIVVAQAPAAGESAREVRITVSSGTRVRVPDVVGLTTERAVDELGSRGLRGVVDQRPADVAAGTVVSTDPGAGTLVAPGSSVTLVVSTGPSPIVVPSVVGLTQAAATSALRDADLDVAVAFVSVPGSSQDGVVVDQDPDAGQRAAAGSTVRISVGRTVAPSTTTA